MVIIKDYQFEKYYTGMPGCEWHPWRKFAKRFKPGSANLKETRKKLGNAQTTVEFY